VATEHHYQTAPIPVNNHNPFGVATPVDLPSGEGLKLDTGQAQGAHDGISIVANPVELPEGLHDVPVRDAAVGDVQPTSRDNPAQSGFEGNSRKTAAGTQPSQLYDDRENGRPNNPPTSASPAPGLEAPDVGAPDPKYSDNIGGQRNPTSANGK
jgi:hypothetical protein